MRFANAYTTTMMMMMMMEPLWQILALATTACSRQPMPDRRVLELFGTSFLRHSICIP